MLLEMLHALAAFHKVACLILPREASMEMGKKYFGQAVTSAIIGFLELLIPHYHRACTDIGRKPLNLNRAIWHRGCW
jgi:hypothetical protein